jgi:hypothetical protein
VLLEGGQDIELDGDAPPTMTPPVSSTLLKLTL